MQRCGNARVAVRLGYPRYPLCTGLPHTNDYCVACKYKIDILFVHYGSNIYSIIYPTEPIWISQADLSVMRLYAKRPSPCQYVSSRHDEKDGCIIKKLFFLILSLDFHHKGWPILGRSHVEPEYVIWVSRALGCCRKNLRIYLCVLSSWWIWHSSES